MSHATARESVMMQIPNVGAFVRALLPVRLSGGDSVTFGVWLAIDPRHDALRKLATVWWNDDEYRDLKIEGWLANAIAVGHARRAGDGDRSRGAADAVLHGVVQRNVETRHCRRVGPRSGARGDPSGLTRRRAQWRPRTARKSAC
jgi:hypothetical protein